MARKLYSRLGCLRCRARKKKCDETHPTCNNCKRNNLECLWAGSDTIVKHWLPANKILAASYTGLKLQDESTPPVPYEHADILRHCSLKPVSNGWPPFRNTEEYQTLARLADFLYMILLKRNDTVMTDHFYEFSVALQEPWTRDALLGFSAFLSSGRQQSLRTQAYKHYHIAISESQKRFQSGNVVAERESLLVTTLFLGMFEINNPENCVLPLLHFEAVGHLLQIIADNISGQTPLSRPAQIFYRIALEAYIYHVSILSLFYPRADKYPKLSLDVEQKLMCLWPDHHDNMIISMDTNIYRMLLEVTTLGRIINWTTADTVRLNRIAVEIDRTYSRIATTKYDEGTTAVSQGQSQNLSKLGLVSLRIIWGKVSNKALLASAPENRELVATALECLQAFQTTRSWTGNLVWICTILLCAAYTEREYESLAAVMDVVRKGWCGGDLKRMQLVSELVKRKRSEKPISTGRDGTLVNPSDHDTLGLLIRPGGVLADAR